jgi:ParB-like chromosome segregation protein Spo0J
MRLSPQERFALEARRHEEAALYLQQWPQHRIAAKFGIDRVTVARDLKWIRQQVWRPNTALKLDERKLHELAKVDRVEQAAWEAWERSLLDAERKEAVLDESGTDGNPVKKTHVKKITEGQSGDARFLEIILKCGERRCGILGIPTQTSRMEHSGPDGQKEVAVKILAGIDPEKAFPPQPKLSSTPTPSDTAATEQPKSSLS